VTAFQRARRAAAWLLLPLWLAQVFTARKAFSLNPILGSVRLNRRGLHAWRTRLAHRLAAGRRAKLQGLLTPDERAAFERDGFLVKRDFLPAAEFAALLAEVGACRRDAFSYVEGRATTHRVPIGLGEACTLPHCHALVESTEWRRLLRYVAACNTPPSVFVEEIAVDGADPVDDPQTVLHMDTFHSTMKAWLFLTDVPEEMGPFTYVPGSHRLTPRRLAWLKRRSVQAAQGGPPGGAFRVGARELKAMRLPGPVRFAVPRNTLVVADTFGFHARGRSLGSARRLEIHAISRENPFTPFLGWELRPLRAQYLRLSAYRFFIGLGLRLGLVAEIKTAPARFNTDG
jgi:hypothetical protein